VVDSDLEFVVYFVWEAESLKGNRLLESFLVHHVLKDLVSFLCI